MIECSPYAAHACKAVQGAVRAALPSAAAPAARKFPVRPALFAPTPTAPRTHGSESTSAFAHPPRPSSVTSDYIVALPLDRKWRIPRVLPVVVVVGFRFRNRWQRRGGGGSGGGSRGGVTHVVLDAFRGVNDDTVKVRRGGVAGGVAGVAGAGGGGHGVTRCPHVIVDQSGFLLRAVRMCDVMVRTWVVRKLNAQRHLTEKNGSPVRQMASGIIRKHFCSQKTSEKEHSTRSESKCTRWTHLYSAM